MTNIELLDCAHFLRIVKLRLQGYKNCEGCGKFTNKRFILSVVRY